MTRRKLKVGHRVKVKKDAEIGLSHKWVYTIIRLPTRVDDRYLMKDPDGWKGFCARREDLRKLPDRKEKIL